VAPGMVAPLRGSPDDQGLNGTSEGGKKNKSGGPRRKVGRWSEEETNTLISLTNQVTQLHQSSFLDCCCLSGPYAHNLLNNSCTTMHRVHECRSNIDCGLAGGFLFVDATA